MDNTLAPPSPNGQLVPVDGPPRLALPPYIPDQDGAPAADHSIGENKPPGKAKFGWKPFAVLAVVAVVVLGLFVAGVGAPAAGPRGGQV